MKAKHDEGEGEGEREGEGEGKREKREEGGMDPAEALPAEVFLRVLSFLPPSSLCTCARVSQDWYSFSAEDYPWFFFSFLFFSFLFFSFLFYAFYSFSFLFPVLFSPLIPLSTILLNLFFPSKGKSNTKITSSTRISLHHGSKNSVKKATKLPIKQLFLDGRYNLFDNTAYFGLFFCFFFFWFGPVSHFLGNRKKCHLQLELSFCDVFVTPSVW